MSDISAYGFQAPIRIRVGIGLLFLIWGVSAGCGDRCSSITSLHLPQRPAVEYADQITFAGRPLAVLGDTQRTSWQECFFFGRRVNDQEQQALIHSLAEEGAGALVMVGDMVFRASDPQHWLFFDELMDPIYKRNIPVLALLGNHEYSGDDEQARSLVNRHFPRLRSTEYYIEQYGRLGLIFLNSNKNKLHPDVWADQLQWYLERLKDFEEDDGVDGIFVFLHHPPFTNSETAAGDRKLAADFVEGFTGARKTLAMISGHAHGYECRRKSGKYHIITAGGGGPLQSRDGTALCNDHDSARLDSSAFFNYLLIEQGEEGIGIQVKGLAEGESSVEQLAFIEIPFAGDKN